jgi:uncharacterized membrane protein
MKGKKMGWYSNGDGMMNGSGFAIFGMVLMVLFFGILVWVIVRTIEHGSHQNRHSFDSHQPHYSSEALGHLDMRLAKGEISPEEYNSLKGHIKK